MLLRTTMFLSMAMMLGCSSTQPSTADCGDSGPCPAGSVCLEDVCRSICRVASDCDDPCSAENPDGESCLDDVCVAGGGCVDLGPVIDGIDGIGEANGNPATAEHVVGSGIRITGTGLAGAGVRLGDQDLTVDSSTATELFACLPAGTTAGVHTITVANQAGATCGDFELVEGAAGPPGTYTGEEAVALVNSGLSANPSLSIVGTMTESDADDRYVNITGDTMSGELTVDAPVAIGRSSGDAALDVRGLLDQALTGVVTITASSQEVLGGGTSFLTELAVGDALMIEGQAYEVETITDDTHLTLTAASTTSAAGVAATRDGNLLHVQTGASASAVQVNRSGTLVISRSVDIGLERVSASCSGIQCDAEALCPPGKLVLGGGCRISSCSKDGFDYSNPTDDLTGWYCSSNECTNTTAYALCARVQ